MNFILIILLGLSFLIGTITGKCADFANDWPRMKSIVPQGYVCYRATNPISIDGRLDDADWQRAAWTHDFQDIEGPAKPAPRFRTRAKMLWDEHYFYVGAELEEPHVWATITNHDAVIFQDNDFEVFIDPNGDSHEYYEIEMNALNAEWDLLLKKPYKDGGKAHDEWEIPGLKTAVHVQGTRNNSSDIDHSWSVELAFPWKALRRYAHRPAPPHEGDQWRVGFSRVEWEIEPPAGSYRKKPGLPENNWVWSPQGIIDMHRPEKWGYVQFSGKEPGTVMFVPDPAMPARNALQEIYYAQRVYQTTHHRWAARIEDLKLSGTLDTGLAKPPYLILRPQGFEAIAVIQSANGKTARWHIREDARVWSN